mmetsp:Transcript_23445/g.44123  ORF Transcript_23445/g.44123 Transcript_23445/m.44123 type:complete len:252 (-) Transcript_23445:109-864(-)
MKSNYYNETDSADADYLTVHVLNGSPAPLLPLVQQPLGALQLPHHPPLLLLEPAQLFHQRRHLLLPPLSVAYRLLHFRPALVPLPPQAFPFLVDSLPDILHVPPPLLPEPLLFRLEVVPRRHELPFDVLHRFLLAPDDFLEVAYLRLQLLHENFAPPLVPDRLPLGLQVGERPLEVLDGAVLRFDFVLEFFPLAPDPLEVLLEARLPPLVVSHDGVDLVQLVVERLDRHVLHLQRSLQLLLLQLHLLDGRR